MGDQPEATLLTRCLEGEAEAWDELFDRHYAATGRFLFQLGYLFTREDVEEICQEVFLSVIKKLRTFQGQSQFQTWLFRIASNKARDYRERQNAAKRGGGVVTVSMDQEDLRFTVDPPSHLPGPDSSLIRQERAAQVGQALAQLGGACQEIIELRYYGDLSYEEISKTLRLNPKTVSSRLSKCLDKLEKELTNLILREKNTTTTV